MGIVKTKDLTFEYIRRDEEGNVEGITTAVDHVNIDLQAGQQPVWRARALFRHPLC